MYILGSEKMRVCHICSNYDKFFVNFMEEQRSKGIDLKVYYFRAKERGWPDVNSSYVDIRLNYSNWQRLFFYIKERSVLNDFFNLYNNTDFDVLHAHTLFSNGYIAWKAKKKWGIPYIVAVRDMDVNVFFKYRIALRSLGIEILNEAEKIIFLSSSYRDHVLSKYVPEKLKDDFREKSLIIPNGVDNFFLESKKSRSLFDKNKTIQIITVGFVSKRKNQETVCKAIESLNNQGIKINYTIVGKVLDNKVFDKIKKYPFVSYIPFLPKEKLIDEYRKADIFVMPSITETFGLTYVEAMSQGLPVIYTKGQGFDGQFKEGVVGYHVESNNSKEIADRIVDILSNYNDISNNCIRMSSEYDWEKIVDEYIELYTQVVKK